MHSLRHTLVAVAILSFGAAPLQAAGLPQSTFEPSQGGQISFTTPSDNIECIYTPKGGGGTYVPEDGGPELSCDRLAPVYLRFTLAASGQGRTPQGRRRPELLRRRKSARLRRRRWRAGAATPAIRPLQRPLAASAMTGTASSSASRMMRAYWERGGRPHLKHRVTPAKAGVHPIHPIGACGSHWIPAFAGMTTRLRQGRAEASLTHAAFRVS